VIFHFNSVKLRKFAKSIEFQIMQILIINGPNLNMIGKREEKYYGVESFEDILAELRTDFPEFGLDYFQSNGEGPIIDRIQAAESDGTQALVINGGAYSHYSIAIMDALKTLHVPKVEVHFSNIYARETFRHKSVLSPVCQGIIAGFGKNSYRLALEWLKLNKPGKIGFGK